MEHAPRSGGSVAGLTGSRIAVAAQATALLTGLAVTFAPWLQVGGSRRTSFETVRSAVELDLLSGTTATLLRVTWVFLPLVTVGALAALFLGRPVLAALPSAVAGGAQLAFASVIKSSPRAVAWGGTAGLVTGAVIIVTAIVTVVVSRRGGTS